MKIIIERDGKYIKAEGESEKYINTILKSSSPKKVVVAGPGTGKTYLFKRMLEGKKNNLTLTFINSLVEDLSLDLYGLSEVRTLHSYARSILGKILGDIEVFPKLAKVICEDAKILLVKDVNFDHIFYNKIQDEQLLSFYNKRRSYYGKYYGYTDIVFTLVRYLEQSKDNIPNYDYVLVDEFQDFNLLEISLIDLLAEKSPVLLVGDDDQALYEDLKSANKSFIRERYGNKYPDYEPFTLPFCQRSTRVIVETVNDIVKEAKKQGLLKGRIEKNFCYFDKEDKDKDSLANPNIVYTQKFAKQIPWFISQQIDEIAKQVKDKFSVLIISPSVKMSQLTVDALRNKGFKNINISQKKNIDERPTLSEGLNLLLENFDDNLGWRIVSKHFLDEESFNSFLKETDKDGAKSFSEIIENDLKDKVNEILRMIRSIKKGEKIENNKLDELLRLFEFDPFENKKSFLLSKLPSRREGSIDAGIRKIPVEATTIQSSKGLSVDYVFITYFDDQYFIDIKNKKITDINVCNFLVALTRAKKGVFLISSNKKRTPVFLSWINKKRINYV